MGFKKWLIQFENLAGPGGGPEDQADRPDLMAKDDARKGVGAFPTIKPKEDPPLPSKRSVLSRYEVKKKV
jgi:hypothetical protein